MCFLRFSWVGWVGWELGRWGGSWVGGVGVGVDGTKIRRNILLILEPYGY